MVILLFKGLYKSCVIEYNISIQKLCLDQESSKRNTTASSPLVLRSLELQRSFLPFLAVQAEVSRSVWAR
ncbi:hypothetical protein EI42_05442 [Thermosporothrix hazakensis]|uniref:Uncharacterized protein n=1 Tax=Thermosporothrix hazakensis TaxID=644383 RepID=A0A326UBV2_THEHA|nr:hypothetical protein EI42_05442 [Thermosporothrix hazakensis]